MISSGRLFTMYILFRKTRYSIALITRSSSIIISTGWCLMQLSAICGIKTILPITAAGLIIRPMMSEINGLLQNEEASNCTGMYYFVQYHLHLQLKDATDYAHSQGVIVKGDIAIG